MTVISALPSGIYLPRNFSLYERNLTTVVGDKKNHVLHEESNVANHYGKDAGRRRPAIYLTVADLDSKLIPSNCQNPRENPGF
jgi:hypothetical protein